MKKIFCVVFTLFVFGSLMAKKPPFLLTFGSGGGFTGLTTTYTVNSDRSFSKEESLNHKKESLKKVKTKDINALRKLIDNVNFPGLNINKPGNMTAFVTATIDGKEYRAQWTGITSGNTALDDLHKKLLSLIPKK